MVGVLMSMKGPVPGQVYEIPDPPRGYYYAMITVGKDCLFFDRTGSSPLNIEDLKRVPFFLRLHVSYPSITRFWKLVGKQPIAGEASVFGKYKVRPVGEDKIFTLNDANGEMTPASPQEIASLETAASWHGKHHIIPILRYHFFRVETDLIENITKAL